MNSVALPNSSVMTTEIGFGCAYLASGVEKSLSIRMVDTAFEAGLRHFDVAPPYGLGTAEDVLGIALAKRRCEVTIASKAGLARPRVGTYLMAIRALATPLRGNFSSFTRMVGSRMVRGERGQFSPESVQRSLTETLRRLRTDYLDLFLLHEAQATDISDELLTFLDKLRKEGVVRAVGVGSSYEAAAEISFVHGNFFDVFQYPWSVLDAGQARPIHTKFVITHRALLSAFDPLRSWFRNDRAAMSRLSLSTGMDLSVDDTLVDVLIGAALNANKGGLVLVASRKIGRVCHFGQVMRDQRLRIAGGKLTAALLAESAGPKIWHARS